MQTMAIVETPDLTRKNLLRARYVNLSPKNKRKFKAEYLAIFEINGRAFYHRFTGRTKTTKEEEKWINKWSSKNQNSTK